MHPALRVPAPVVVPPMSRAVVARGPSIAGASRDIVEAIERERAVRKRVVVVGADDNNWSESGARRPLAELAM